MLAAVIGMALAVSGTLLDPHIITYKWIAIAAVPGTIVGYPLARVPLTAVPERTGLSQSFGGLAAALVGTRSTTPGLADGQLSHFRMAVIAGEVILGGITCTGGLMAAGKLAEWITTQAGHLQGTERRQFRPAGVAVGIGAYLIYDPTQSCVLPGHHRARRSSSASCS